MPFDPLPRPFEPPRTPRPSPSAPTPSHGLTMMLGVAAIVILLTMMLNITYTLDLLGRIADLLHG
jgi:hypothetical protein